MVIWGGQDAERYLNTAARFDPANNQWLPWTQSIVPAPRAGSTAVWTGSQMIVWGGFTVNSRNANTGGRYDPALDSWTPTSLNGAPSARSRHSAVWTGNSMIIWDGIGDPTHPINFRGRRYNP